MDGVSSATTRTRTRNPIPFTLVGHILHPSHFSCHLKLKTQVSKLPIKLLFIHKHLSQQGPRPIPPHPTFLLPHTKINKERTKKERKKKSKNVREGAKTSLEISILHHQILTLEKETSRGSPRIFFIPC